MGAIIRARRERFEEWVRDEGGALDEIGQRMGDGETLREICAGLDIPQSRVMAWLMADVKRWEVYVRAVKALAWGRVEEAIGIADGADKETVVVAKLQVDTRFRQAALYDPERLSPKANADVGAIADGFTEALRRISERKREAIAQQQSVPAPVEREINPLGSEAST